MHSSKDTYAIRQVYFPTPVIILDYCLNYATDIKCTPNTDKDIQNIQPYPPPSVLSQSVFCLNTAVSQWESQLGMVQAVW